MIEDLFSLRGRTAIVTGGSRGIGRMIAAGFLAAGAKVYITSRKANVCETAAAELSASGGECIALPHDISTMDGCRALVEDFAAREASLDILVNNAGTVWGAPFDDFPESGWDKVLDLNLKTPFFLTQMLAPALRRSASPQRAAKVINVASTDGLKPSPDETYSYHASKSGLIFLTRRMAARLISDNICVNAIAPGAFVSDMNRAARDHGDALAARIPARRIGEAADMQGVSIFLASRAGDYAVGVTISIDGGVVYGTAVL